VAQGSGVGDLPLVPFFAMIAARLNEQVSGVLMDDRADDFWRGIGRTVTALPCAI
jgi:hypothetical protein